MGKEAAVRKIRNRFGGITIFTVVFAFIYECFSHGVYSAFMIGAALIPLVGVVLPYTIWLGRLDGKALNRREYSAGEKGYDDELPFVWHLYQSAVLTFLLGSVFSGILEIYGTTNRLSKMYWIAGGVLLVASLGLKCRQLLSK